MKKRSGTRSRRTSATAAWTHARLKLDLARSLLGAEEAQRIVGLGARTDGRRQLVERHDRPFADVLDVRAPVELTAEALDLDHRAAQIVGDPVPRGDPFVEPVEVVAQVEPGRVGVADGPRRTLVVHGRAHPLVREAGCVGHGLSDLDLGAIRRPHGPDCELLVGETGRLGERQREARVARR